MVQHILLRYHSPKHVKQAAGKTANMLQPADSNVAVVAASMTHSVSPQHARTKLMDLPINSKSEASDSPEIQQ
jgi:hypothetical protein